MRMLTAIFVILIAATVTTAQNLDRYPDLSAKGGGSPSHSVPVNDPRVGGDTVDDATPIPGIPYTDTGNTCGYVDNYDWDCPYQGNAPDVVYSFTPDSDIHIDIDFCETLYDNKCFVYDSALNVIACNDDFYFDDVCGIYVAKLEDVALVGMMTYYIVVDGYGADCGEYIMLITEHETCTINCHVDAIAEGEPPLVDEYEDNYNGGCGAVPPAWQPIDWINVEPGHPDHGKAWLCGVSGWYLGQGGEYRDTDWFLVTALETGTMECTLESEQPTYLFKLSPTDCASVGVEINVEADCDAPGTMSFPVTAGEEIWLWVGPSTFTGPVNEYPYYMTVTNNVFNTIPNEDLSWGRVKTLYR